MDAVEYDGASERPPAPGVLEALADADAIVLAPSNPYLSIGPILAVDAIREAIDAPARRCVAVSPLVGGAAVTGPPTVCSRAWQAGRLHATWRVVTRADRRPRDRRGRRSGGGRRRARRRADAHARPTRTSGAWPRSSWRRRARSDRRRDGAVRRALATRLVEAGVEVVIGSRDAARAQEVARELGCTGATNAEACAEADLVVLAVNADAALDTARELRDAIGTTPVLSVASELRFSKAGALPSEDAASLAERIQAELDAPVVAGLHSLAASSLGGDEPPDEDAFVCGDDPEAKALALELAAHSRPAAHSTQARSRAPARSRVSRR